MLCFPFSFGRKGSPPNIQTEVDEEVSGISNVIMYSYKDLRIATDDFSPTHKIGEGGFGSVYKGRLKNGIFVAIKVLSAWSKQGVREFLTEINVISDIEHENLVKLHGCCVESNHRILVYGYLENNSLSRTLLGGGHHRMHFNWKTRSKICIGVARGLAYLHEEVRPHIIHRDIKASNILLDKDLNPKISDFGLAKLIPANMTHVSTRVAGTIGYLAPEYAIRGQLTRKADIYSLGVLILEIVSGRPNTNTRLPYDEQYILERICNRWITSRCPLPILMMAMHDLEGDTRSSRGDPTVADLLYRGYTVSTWALHERNELVLLVDTALDGDFDAEEACRFLKIGLLCTQDSPKLRPSMSNVLKMLTGEVAVDDKLITKPGLISDFMDLKIRDDEKKPCGSNNTSYTVSSGSGSDKACTTPSTIENTNSYATMTFTAIEERSY